MSIIRASELLAVAVAPMVALSVGCATVASVQLQPEMDSTVHVGEVAALRLASDRYFSIGSAGRALVLIDHKHADGETIYFYRAVAVGRQTIVATPRDPGPDGCVSCVTVRYFTNVIP